MNLPNTAFLLDSAPRTWSSLEELHLRTCQALIEHGSHPVLVFSQELPREIHNQFAQAGVTVAAINYEDGFANYYKQLRQLIERHSIERAHIAFFDYFRAVAWLTRLQGLKSIVYEMGNGGLFKANSWKKELLHLRNRVMTAPFGRIIAISHYIKSQLIAAGVPEEKIVVRHLGVDNARFKPDSAAGELWRKKLSIPADELILSTVSYLRPIKNPQIIVEACAVLAQRGLRSHLVVAGDGEMLGELRQLSIRLGIGDRVHWLGLVPDPASLLQASDLFLLATVGEAFGLALAEAMACGVPVVGSRAGALPEVVKDGETGVLVNPLDPIALADGIEKLGRDDALRRRMAQDAILNVAENFTAEQSVAATLQIYNTL